MPTPWIDSPDAARAEFRAAAAARGWAFESHAFDSESGLDAAVWPGDPARTLIITGGVHGVESPLGVAACLQFLTDHPRPAGRVVLIPVVNPAGFRLGRRAAENNTDLNRNFLLPGELYRGAPPYYARVDPILNPQSAPGYFDDFLLRTALATMRHGWRALKDAIAGGQYDFPRGLFYGGDGPADSVRVLAANWRCWLAGARSVTHLDFHTGLGPWASYKLLLDVGETPHRVEFAARLGPTEVATRDGVSYEARGTFGPWARHRSGVSDYCYICAEFGTYSGLTMIRGVRRENRAYQFAPGSAADAAAKAHLRELFAPADAGWRRRVLAGARGLVAGVVRQESG